MMSMASFGDDVVVYGGSAAGVGAAMAAEGDQAVQDVSNAELRRRLEKRGAVVTLQPAPRRD